MRTPFFDNTQAMAEGWAISECLGHDLPWQLQQMDDKEEFPNPFQGDGDAWTFVITKAAEGSDYHKDALRFLRDHCAEEFEDLVIHAAPLNLREII